VSIIESVDAKALSVGDLETELVAGAWSAHGTRFRLLKLLAAYDDCGGWIAHGATSCAVWWADVSGIARNTAREHLRVARALDSLPQLDSAMADGRLSYAKAKVISRYADESCVDELIELAEDVPAGNLGIHLALWQKRNAGDEAISQAQHDARSLSWRVDPDGMFSFTYRARPTDGATLAASIDAQVMRSRAPAGASLAQLRADALVEVLSSGRSAGAEVVVHVTNDAKGGLVAALLDGTPVPKPQLGEILCEATIRALLHDCEGRPIDASPKRRGPTTRQLRLLEARDRCCRFPGCTAQVFLHAHHLRHREDGGPTIIANLVSLCSFHHRLIHHDTDAELKLLADLSD